VNLHPDAARRAMLDMNECLVESEDGVSDDAKTIIFDPQTAGGLLISVASESADALRQALKAAGVPAAEIGEAILRTEPLIRVIN
jgi:selenide, water dikinase